MKYIVFVNCSMGFFKKWIDDNPYCMDKNSEGEYLYSLVPEGSYNMKITKFDNIQLSDRDNHISPPVVEQEYITYIDPMKIRDQKIETILKK